MAGASRCAVKPAGGASRCAVNQVGGASRCAARASIAAGERIIEYKGEVISWPEAQRRHPHDPKDPNHTFYFHIDDKHVIDAKVGGNAARWINHACNPNCESDIVGDRVFIKALRPIKPDAFSPGIKWAQRFQRRETKWDVYRTR